VAELIKHKWQSKAWQEKQEVRTWTRDVRLGTVRQDVRAQSRSPLGTRNVRVGELARSAGCRVRGARHGVGRLNGWLAKSLCLGDGPIGLSP
jgi:hypothetical protein